MFRMKTTVVLAVLLLAVNVSFSQQPRPSFYDCDVSACAPFESMPCDPCESVFCDPCAPLSGCGKNSVWDSVSVYGWLQAGLTINNHGRRNQYTDDPNALLYRNLDMTSGNSFPLMSKQPTDFSVYQAWLGVAKRIDTKRGFDWGFQMDAVFGTDAKYPQCFGDQTFDYDWGSGDYDFSIPQLFAEVGYRNLKVRIGKFATGMTHEVLPAIASFFHSYAFACYSTPLTASGVIVEYKVGSRLSFSGGWTAGYHNSFTNRFDDSGFLGNITFSPSDSLKLSYNLYFGRSNGYDKVIDADRFGRAYDTATHVTQTVIGTLNLGKNWLYMVEAVWSNNNYEAGPNEMGTNSCGINQHLIYTINKRWAVGLRAEWSHGKGTIFDLAPMTGGNGCDLYALTLGANWTPNAWFILRPEIRYDWTKYYNGLLPFADGTRPNQLTAGGSAIVKF